MFQFLCPPAYAHPNSGKPMLWEWNQEWGLLLVLIGCLLLYGWLVGPFRKQKFPNETVSRQHMLCFIVAIACFYTAATAPVLDELGERFLFSAHMIQHTVLLYPVPWLILWGTPPWLATYLFDRPFIMPIRRFLTHPIVTFSAFNVCFGVWHIPELYELALQNRFVHDLEHLSFLGVALLMWCPLMAPIQQWRLSPGLQMLYLLALNIGQLPVFAYITFSQSVLYPTYEVAERIFAISALADQQLGGVIMKIVGMTISGTSFFIIFYNWFKEENKELVRHPLVNL